MYSFIHIYTYIHTYTYTYIYTYIYIHKAKLTVEITSSLLAIALYFF